MFEIISNIHDYKEAIYWKVWEILGFKLANIT